MSLTITIPLPPVELNPHAKGNRWAKSRATKDHREVTRLLALSTRVAQESRCFERATIYPTFFLARTALGAKDGLYRPLDSTNAAASLKAAVDGLVDAGVLYADDHRRVRMMPPVLLRTKKEHGGRTEVVLLIEEWTENGGGGERT